MGMMKDEAMLDGLLPDVSVAACPVAQSGYTGAFFALLEHNSITEERWM